MNIKQNKHLLKASYMPAQGPPGGSSTVPVTDVPVSTVYPDISPSTIVFIWFL